MRLSTFIQGAVLVALATATGPQVDVGYATYEGTALSNGVNQFLGMRYAASPVGDNRFRAPKPPTNESGIIDAKEVGNICFGVQGLSSSSNAIPASEDCLFIDVYAPENATGLPVMLWIQGGAFVQLINPNYNGTGLVAASGHNVIVVTFNYRVGPYGFLASRELAEERNLNIGLHDQRAAMRWVQDHISHFGGDPNMVTLFGTSIGGGSVLLQTLAYGGTPSPENTIQWRAGIGEAIYLPTVRQVNDLEFQYQQLLNATNCTDLPCLRSLDSATIQAANVGSPFVGQSAVPLFPYGAVVDGELLTDIPSAMLEAGKFAKDKSLILGSSHTEGTIFAPKSNTTETRVTFLRTQYPDLTESDIALASDLYANTSSTVPSTIASMYGDISFSCPTLDFATGLSKAGLQTHLFRDAIMDPVEVAAGFGTPHTWGVQAVWGPEYAVQFVALPGANSYDEGGVNHAMVDIVQKYWISFAITGGNPNILRNAQTPVWEDYNEGQRLRLQANATAIEPVQQYELERCAFWKSVSARTHV